MDEVAGKQRGKAVDSEIEYNVDIQFYYDDIPQDTPAAADYRP
jgi:hypothetical protein